MNNKKNGSNAIKVYLTTLNSFTIYLNIMMLDQFCSSVNENWKELELLKDAYFKLDDTLKVSEEDVNDERTINNIAKSAKEYLKELKNFKKLPANQDDKIQKLIDMGIKEVSNIVSNAA